jgi:hypothetical protein
LLLLSSGHLLLFKFLVVQPAGAGQLSLLLQYVACPFCFLRQLHSKCVCFRHNLSTVEFSPTSQYPSYMLLDSTTLPLHTLALQTCLAGSAMTGCHL